MRLLLIILITLLCFNSQAQTLCEQTYTTGNYYVFEVAIPTTGNGLPEMIPLYATTSTQLDTWVDSCFGGPCTHTIFNEYNEDTITTCISYTLTDSFNNIDTLDCCFTQYWDGNAWSIISDSDTVIDYLYTICDTLEVISEVSTEEWVILSTNLFFLDYLNSNNILDEISFSWESWGNNLVSESSSSITFNAPNSEDDYYFILEILLNEDNTNTSVLCQYPFLIDWNPYNYMWQPLSIQMSQLPTSIDSYQNESQNSKRLLKLTDIFGREVKEEKNKLLFYIYEDGRANKTYLIK